MNRNGTHIAIPGIPSESCFPGEHTIHPVKQCILIIDGKLFTGDTLFFGSYGNTNFPGGSYAEIKNSIKNKLFGLEGDFEVFPGHGENTTLDYERKFNYINDDNYR